MYSRWLNLNHRLRLSALLTATVSAALAAVFLLVVLVVQDQAINRRYSELKTEIERFSQEWTSPDSIRELQEDLPGSEVAVFGADGALLKNSARIAPPLVNGRQKNGDRLTLGVRTGSYTFVGTCSWTETQAGINQLELVLAGLWLPLTILVATVSWYGGGLVLSPVRELVASAERLSETMEDELLKTSDRAEFASLAESLNQLITRVRHAGALQEQFASDAAHELRTPLAILRTRVEANLKRERSNEEHVASQKAMLVQIDRLTSMIEALLFSARRPGMSTDVLDFAEAVGVAAKEWAELRGWSTTRLSLKLQSCETRISREEVEIVVRNLLDNGARYSTSGSPLEVEVTSERGIASLRVRDFGQGITAEEASRAFVRFYRSDDGRNRKDGGAGIGLAVVLRIAEAAGGTVNFIPVEEGALVCLTMPVTARDR